MAENRALLVIDMQNDYLWPQRKAMFSYDTASLVGAVNAAVAAYQAKGYDIIYIAQVFPNIITNRWIIGFSIKDTPGAAFYEGLDVVSDLCFEKNLPDTYTAKAFREFAAQRQYSEIVLCGLDECGCVGATAKGAVKTGAKVTMLENCIGRRFPEARVQNMRSSLRALGVTYETLPLTEQA